MDIGVAWYLVEIPVNNHSEPSPLKCTYFWREIERERGEKVFNIQPLKDN